MSTLIFGGTFDPPHRAHVQLPPLVAARLQCERILYVPTSMNPLKHEQPTAPHHRLAMLQLATEDVAGAEISTAELEQDGPGYTVDLLEELKRDQPDETFHLMLGADAVLSFDRWRKPQRILELATPAVVLRPPWGTMSWKVALHETFDDAQTRAWINWTIDVPVVDVCSTEVRRRLAEGQGVDAIVPAAVVAYIRAHELYRATRV